jgi:hypothetical protein
MKGMGHHTLLHKNVGTHSFLYRWQHMLEVLFENILRRCFISGLIHLERSGGGGCVGDQDRLRLLFK